MSSEEVNKDIKKKDDVQNQDDLNFLKDATHPKICFFTLLFKSISILSFIVLRIISVEESITFLTVVLATVVDFWYIKNVSGRVLVGLRWWNEIREDGEDVWIYESSCEVRNKNLDTIIFWGCIYITPLFWTIFFIWDTLRFSIFLIIAFICMVLAFSNLIGYFRCSKSQQNIVKDFIKNRAEEQITKNLNKIE